MKLKYLFLLLLFSVVTLFELHCGATTPEKWNDIEKLMNGVNILPLSPEISVQAALIFMELKNENKIIEFGDIFIAATAREYCIPVKTFNPKHFKRIKNIEVI